MVEVVLDLILLVVGVRLVLDGQAVSFSIVTYDLNEDVNTLAVSDLQLDFNGNPALVEVGPVWSLFQALQSLQERPEKQLPLTMACLGIELIGDHRGKPQFSNPQVVEDVESGRQFFVELPF